MSDFRSYSMDPFPPVVKNLIIINVLVFVAQLTLGITGLVMLYPEMPDQLHTILVNAKVLEPQDRFKFYQIITHMFAHSPNIYIHIIFNMLALYTFGRQLENRWGGKRFLSFYLLCGVGAAALHLAVQYFRSEQVLQEILANQPDAGAHLSGAIAPALGASGAVMGIFAAFAYLFPNEPLYLYFIPIPIKAKWLLIGLAAYDVFGGIDGTDNVAHFAHLGGALTGIIMVWIWNRDRRQFY